MAICRRSFGRTLIAIDAAIIAAVCAGLGVVAVKDVNSSLHYAPASVSMGVLAAVGGLTALFSYLSWALARLKRMR